MAQVGYTTAYKKVSAGAKPRCVALCGTEAVLRNKLSQLVLANPDNEIYAANGASFDRLEPFLCGARPSKTKLVHITAAQNMTDWDWLPVWFNKVPKARLLLESVSTSLMPKLERTINTRGIVVDCSRPSSNRAINQLLAIVASWYPQQSPSMINLLLNKNDWHITECAELLDKLTILNSSLTSDTIDLLGINVAPEEQFANALKNDNSRQALLAVNRVNDLESVLAELSSWLDKLARVKSYQGLFKSANEIAYETGESRTTVELLQRQTYKFSFQKINQAALALASADKDCQLYGKNTLEILANSW